MESMDGEKRPTLVKVGPYDYKVIWTDLQREQDCVGLHSALQLEITLDCKLPKTLLAVTFLHEVCHALYAMTHDQGESITHEEQADLYANGLTAFWRDNPRTFEWWRGLLA